jgi:hypothetical protein
MDCIDGITLATILKKPTETEQDEVILATNMDDMKLDYVYEQLADLLQLSHLDFSTIGAILKSLSSNEWIACDRPLS